MTEPVPVGRAPQRWWRARPESWWWIALIVLVPVIVLTGAAAWVLLATTHPTQAADQINLVKTALAVGAGTGGVITLILASRRQWHTEQAQLGTEHDATQRRITDLYTKAVDQLGSEKAPVRLGGLYALERLAQDNPGQRQTIVNVMCAYLRMPYTPTTEQPPADDAPEPEHVRFETCTQERQVRLTAQRVLATHLHPGDDPDHPVDTFWPDIDLDLTGATLIDFTVSGCHLRTARFNQARFAGTAWFNKTKFTGDAQFGKTEFAGTAWFGGARFAGDVAWFDQARFAHARFSKARFTGVAWFDQTEFADTARFGETEFASEARFGKARFAGGARFGKARFAGAARFDEARFAGAAGFFGSGSWVRLDVSDDIASRQVWPTGWTVKPSPERPAADVEGEWGLLVYQSAWSPALDPESGTSGSTAGW